MQPTSPKNTPKIDDKRMDPYQQGFQDDEIDLRELIKVLWAYKWLTVIMCAIAIIGSVFYALHAPQKWDAKATIIKPDNNSTTDLYLSISKVSGILDDFDAKTDRFDALVDPQQLLASFVLAFNSLDNKKIFLQQNPIFLRDLKVKQIQRADKELTAKNKVQTNNYQNILNSWAANIKAIPNKKDLTVSLSLQSNSPGLSAALLNAYIKFICQKIRNKQYEILIVLMDGKIKDLTGTLDIAIKTAKLNLASKIIKTDYAYKISLLGGVINYQKNSGDNNALLPIYMGSKALKAQIKVLKSISDPSVFNPKIALTKIKLDALNALTINKEDRNFMPFRFQQEVTQPLHRTSPKRALIVVLATLLAGMLSFFIALVHHYIIKEE
ncbi:MAG: chain length determinant-like protein [Psychromonas sp.]|nr:chain length determinant-like protein [Psychromonas sp.]